MRQASKCGDTHKPTFVHLWVAMCLAGRVAHNDAGGRVYNLVDVILKALRPYHREDASFCVGADRSQQFRTGEACSSHRQHVIHNGDFIRHEEWTFRLNAIQVNRYERSLSGRRIRRARHSLRPRQIGLHVLAEAVLVQDIANDFGRP